MSRRLLLPLGLLVTALVVVAALAAGAHPLGGGGGKPGGPSSTFFDYTFTTFLIFAVAIGGSVLWILLTHNPNPNQRRPGRFHNLVALLYFGACALIAWGISSSGFERRLQHSAQQHGGKSGKSLQPAQGSGTPGSARNAQVRWDEVAVALALLAAAGVAAFTARNRRRLPALGFRSTQRESLAATLDESLDDLRAEPDLRKAIVAAYARMERALAAAGLPRRPAEAPLEYVERALLELEASADAARRLTDLFEWAKFSQHEPGPEMRDEAIDALVAVRDELRQPEREPVAA